MNTSRSRRNRRDVVIRTVNGSGRIRDIMVRNTRKILQLEGKDYHVYQIIQPKGYEKEKIFHRPSRGQEQLLSMVFDTLAEASRQGMEKGRRISAKKQAC